MLWAIRGLEKLEEDACMVTRCIDLPPAFPNLVLPTDSLVSAVPAAVNDTKICNSAAANNQMRAPLFAFFGHLFQTHVVKLAVECESGCSHLASCQFCNFRCSWNCINWWLAACCGRYEVLKSWRKMHRSHHACIFLQLFQISCRPQRAASHHFMQFQLQRTLQKFSILL